MICCVRSNSAKAKPHALIVDEVNRADLGRVLGEAVTLFEPSEPDRSVMLPHVPEGHPPALQLSPQLFVLGTRNTADRSIAASILRSVDGLHSWRSGRSSTW